MGKGASAFRISPDPYLYGISEVKLISLISK